MDEQLATSTTKPMATKKASMPSVAALIATVGPHVAAVSQKLIHTRTCNGRNPCSCFLRLQSSYFQIDLDTKRTTLPVGLVDALPHGQPPLSTPQKKKKRRVGSKRPNLPGMSLHGRVLDKIVAFLHPRDVAQLSMVTKAMRKEVNDIAKRESEALAAAPESASRVLGGTKIRDESWLRYYHVQRNCVHRLFVYYTGYKTAQMRQNNWFWSFGIVEVDPNNAGASIMPNTWKFCGHEPWIKQRANGKDGEWRLRDPYKRGRVPLAFRHNVERWAAALRPGAFLTVAYQNTGSDEPAWWEAQVWHTWHAHDNSAPVEVYDAAADTTLLVEPNDLLDHFKANPLHVVDVCTPRRKLCTMCKKRKLTFYQCHVEKGHPML